MTGCAVAKRRWAFVSWGVSTLLLLSTTIFRDYAVICVAISVVLSATALWLFVSSEKSNEN
ncbi:hypothetical protein AN946_01860 [Trueperella pyogenes]|nr:hypothetical protein AN946_01860 [Trueperella pyogenes]